MKMTPTRRPRGEKSDTEDVRGGAKSRPAGSIAPATRWKVCSGSVILNAAESGESIAPYIDEGAGIYFWKISFQPQPWEISNAAAMVEWLNRLATTTRARSDTHAISHILQVPTIELRGRELPKDKSQYLLEFLRSPKARHWMKRYVESLEPFAPTLYVGESANLRKRALEHVRYLTDFGLTVQESEDLSWERLNFHYLVLRKFEEKPEQLRRSLEYISAALTIAGLTKRPG